MIRRSFLRGFITPVDLARVPYAFTFSKFIVFTDAFASQEGASSPFMSRILADIAELRSQLNEVEELELKINTLGTSTKATLRSLETSVRQWQRY